MSRLSTRTPALLLPRQSYASQVCYGPHRSVVFSQPGDPLEVVSVKTFPIPLPPPGEGEVQLRMLLAPINPSDVNVIQGVYPMKPKARHDLGTDTPVFIPGNEGLGEVVKLGPSTSGWRVGDRVVMGALQTGTWANYMNIAANTLISVRPGVTDIQAATMSVNMTTALTMLRHFVKLSEGDYVLQNGANSAVGQAVIQIAHGLGLKTINFVRDRPGISDLKASLIALGADHVLSYDELGESSIVGRVREWTGGKDVRLALNCVSGKDTTSMLRLVGKDAHLVSYGAMSKQPLSLSTSLFIFKNLTAHGFMMSSWFEANGIDSRRKVLDELMTMFENGLLKEPLHEVVTLDTSSSDENMTVSFRHMLRQVNAGLHGRKLVLRFPPEHLDSSARL